MRNPNATLSVNSTGMNASVPCSQASLSAKNRWITANMKWSEKLQRAMENPSMGPIFRPASGHVFLGDDAHSCKIVLSLFAGYRAPLVHQHDWYNTTGICPSVRIPPLPIGFARFRHIL
jgi:hypothetical protein